MIKIQNKFQKIKKLFFKINSEPKTHVNEKNYSLTDLTIYSAPLTYFVDFGVFQSLFQR